MKLYKDRIHSRIIPQSEELSCRFFLTFTGKEFRKINEWIQDVSKLYDVDVPNPTVHRKWIDSTAHGECDEAEMRVLNAHMSHSETTSRKHYQKQKPEHALQSVEQIQQLTKDRLILHEFTSEQTPPLMICQRIIDHHKELQGRTKKNIQDRWRVLKKKYITPK